MQTSMQPSRRLKALAAACVMALALPAAAALDAVKVMVPANPGGGWDQVGRSLGAAMIASGNAKKVSYDNKGGAAGAIGIAQFVNSSKGDPNALMVMGAVMIGGLEMNKSPIKLKQVTPIARLVADTMIVVVPASSKIQNMKELMAAIKANPGAVSWGGGSKGSVDQILAGMMTKEAGANPAKTNYVPFAGGGEASAAILGGHVTAGLSGISEFLPFVKSGKMRALAVSSSKRMEGIPTLKEQGVNIEIYNWRGVYAAPGITPEQRKTLIDAVVKTTESAAWKETLKKNDWSPFLLTGDEFGRYVDAETTRLGGYLHELGLVK